MADIDGTVSVKRRSIPRSIPTSTSHPAQQTTMAQPRGMGGTPASPHPLTGQSQAPSPSPDHAINVRASGLGGGPIGYSFEDSRTLFFRAAGEGGVRWIPQVGAGDLL